jgi:hypothetical protein
MGTTIIRTDTATTGTRTDTSTTAICIVHIGVLVGSMGIGVHEEHIGVEDIGGDDGGESVGNR